MNSVLLIQPRPAIGDEDTENFPTESPPIGVITLGAFLRSKGIDVHVVDQCANPTMDINALISDLKPELVGISSMTCDFPAALEISKSIKQSHDLPIVMGGPHPTIFPKEVLQHDTIDYVVVGEGERALYQLIEGIKDRESQKAIGSLGYKRNGDIIVNLRQPSLDIESLPFPDYSLLDNEKYISFGEKYLGFRHLVIVMSRGCTGRCSFCAQHQVWGRQFRIFSPERAFSEIRKLMETYNVEGFWSKDSILTIKNWMIPFCAAIQREKLNIKWACLGRVDQIERKMVATMKAAGCVKLWIGGEAGSDRMLKMLTKDINVEKTRQAFQICKEEGLETAAFFMFALPTETVEEMEQTFELARELRPDPMHLAIYHPLPGTELYEKYNGYEVIKKATSREMLFDQACMSTGPVSKELVQEIYDSICKYFFKNGPEPDFKTFKQKAT